MIQQVNNKTYILLDEEREQSLHKDAFEDTYKKIKQFSEQSQKINYHNKSELENIKESFVHQVLCSPPGHGKTTALEYHIKQEIIKTKARKNSYLLVFNNKDTMNTFYESIMKFANEYKFMNAIIAIDESNVNQFKERLNCYQIVCIVQQRLRDLAIGFGDVNLFLKYVYADEKLGKSRKITTSRTVIIDEMPIFFNSVVFDIGKENNMLDWYDAFAKNTSDKDLDSKGKNKGRLYISKLINAELNNIGNTTLKLNRSIVSTNEEVELLNILKALNKNSSDNNSINRYNMFMRLLNEDNVGAINNKSQKNILCSDFIDYKPFGNILILDGTAKESATIYNRAGFQIEYVHNYHRYTDRLRFITNKINTSSYKRDDPKGDIKEQIAEDIIKKRSRGINILPIPAKNDIGTYLKLGAITPEQHDKFFMDRQYEDDSMAINIHNLTGKNDLSQYNHIALLNLPILRPDEYRLQAIAIFGTSIDLRLVKELNDNKEKQLHKGKWFVDQRLQNLFIEQQKAELSQIIHRSSIRNINSDEKVMIHMYHNKENVTVMLGEVFNLTYKNFLNIDIQKKNSSKVKCKKWAEQINTYLRNIPNKEFTAFQAGGKNFRYWINDNWNENEMTIRRIFNEYKITIEIKGKGNYKYFSYIDNGVFNNSLEDEVFKRLLS